MKAPAYTSIYKSVTYNVSWPDGHSSQIAASGTGDYRPTVYECSDRNNHGPFECWPGFDTPQASSGLWSETVHDVLVDSSDQTCYPATYWPHIEKYYCFDEGAPLTYSVSYSGGGGGGQCQPTMPPPYNPPCGDSWNTQSCCWQPQQCGSPILVDTSGKGFELTSAEKGVLFDIGGTGHPLQIAWTTGHSGNAFLALDRNGNGKIDGGKELFGNFTDQPSSSDPNGFRALAEFDKPENGGNGDGIIDGRDAIFSHLLLWIDENHDGISQPNELHSLPELGVFSLPLKYDESRRTDQFGNRFRYKAALNPAPQDGESRDGRLTYDVFFVELSEGDRPAAVSPSAKGPPSAIDAADHRLR